jgi:hypothetical protein
LEQESVSQILIQWPLPIQTALNNYKLSMIFIQWPVLIETAIHRFKFNIDIFEIQMYTKEVTDPR